MDTYKKIHGHEVMEMMATAGKSYTRGSLRADIIEKFGESTRFHTCSAEDLNADGIIDFLESKGKFTGSTESFTFEEQNRCDHE